MISRRKVVPVRRILSSSTARSEVAYKIAIAGCNKRKHLSRRHRTKTLQARIDGFVCVSSKHRNLNFHCEYYHLMIFFECWILTRKAHSTTRTSACDSKMTSDVIPEQTARSHVQPCTEQYHSRGEKISTIPTK